MFVGRVRQMVVLCRVNTTKYYLGGLVSGRYGGVVVIEVVFKTGSIVQLKLIPMMKDYHAKNSMLTYFPILTDSVYIRGKSYYPQVLLDKCKHNVKDKEIKQLITKS